MSAAVLFASIMTLEIFDFWLELTLVAVLACLLIYGIFDTRYELARR